MAVVVNKYVIRKKKVFPEDLRQEILKLHEMILYNEIRMFNAVTTASMIKEETIIAAVRDYNPKENVNVVAKKLGFKNTNNLLLELCTEGYKMLVVDCFLYFLNKHKGMAYFPELPASLLWLIRVSTDEVARAIKGFTHDKSNIDLIPILLEKPRPFHEIICNIILCFKVSSADIQKIDSAEIAKYVGEKIRRALHCIPTTFDRLSTELCKLDYKSISLLIDKDNAMWNEKLKGLPPIMKLRDSYAQQIEDLIRKQVFKKMADGVTVEILGAKAKKSAAKEETFLKLNPTTLSLEYGIEPALVKLPCKDINKVYTAEATLGRVDEKLIKKIVTATLLLIEAKSGEKHTFSIDVENHKLISDCIKLAENRKIDDTWKPEGYTALLDAVMQVLLIDLDPADIPASQPSLPSLPENMNFVFKNVK